MSSTWVISDTMEWRRREDSNVGQLYGSMVGLVFLWWCAWTIRTIILNGQKTVCLQVIQLKSSFQVQIRKLLMGQRNKISHVLIIQAICCSTGLPTGQYLQKCSNAKKCTSNLILLQAELHKYTCLGSTSFCDAKQIYNAQTDAGHIQENMDKCPPNKTPNLVIVGHIHLDLFCNAENVLYLLRETSSVLMSVRGGYPNNYIHTDNTNTLIQSP